MKRPLTNRFLRSTLLAALGLTTFACVSVPERYRHPAQVYEPQLERLSVVGFQQEEWRPTGKQVASLVLPQLGLYAVGGGVQGEYHKESEAFIVRWLIEDTHCARRVDEAGTAPIRVEGQSGGDGHTGWIFGTLNVFLIFTLTPIFGMPIYSGADGWATARIYRDDEFVGAISSTTRLQFATTIYTSGSDKALGAAYARGMALREIADSVAARLCGGGVR